jgi:hypothetical protein
VLLCPKHVTMDRMETTSCPYVPSDFVYPLDALWMAHAAAFSYCCCYYYCCSWWWWLKTAKLGTVSQSFSLSFSSLSSSLLSFSSFLLSSSLSTVRGATKKSVSVIDNSTTKKIRVRAPKPIFTKCNLHESSETFF